MTVTGWSERDGEGRLRGWLKGRRGASELKEEGERGAREEERQKEGGKERATGRGENGRGEGEHLTRKRKGATRRNTEQKLLTVGVRAEPWCVPGLQHARKRNEGWSARDRWSRAK